MATFGYTDIGDTTDSYTDSTKIKLCQFTLSENGSVTGMSFYVRAQSGTANVQVAIYDASYNREMYSSSVNVGTSYSWVNFSVSGELTAGNYYLCYAADAALYVKRYSSGTNAKREKLSETFGVWPDPMGSPNSDGVGSLSIYATYTPNALAIGEHSSTTIAMNW